jgi:uncharacterized protein (TIGR03435 family)
MRLSELWNASWVVPLADHLWQSTVVAAAVWLLALALRRNPAAARYRLWIAASIKFLFPFSLFMTIGEYVHPSATRAVDNPALTAAVNQIAEPFQSVQPVAVWTPAATLEKPHLLPILLVALWLCGVLLIAVRWAIRWRRIRATSRMAKVSGIKAGVPVQITPALLEPGVFGIFRPVILLPEKIVVQLSGPQLNAILEHEMCHVKRRDNLTYAIHMTVAALFWFYPLVGWIGARLLEERERACDEAVLQCGSEAGTYAEGILNVCKYCVESPLPCAAGVSGSDLKKRVVRIMSERVVNRLGMSRKILLGAAVVAAIAVPTAIGIFRVAQTAVLARAQDAPADIPKFDVATIKPNKSGEMRMMMRFVPDGLTMEGVPVQLMIQGAFNVEQDRVLGAPGWVKTDRYDVQAKVAPEDAPKLDKLKPEQRQEMLQPLLEDRFNLKFHHETREMPVYALVVAKGGPKLKASAPPEGGDAAKGKFGSLMMGVGNLESAGSSVDMLAHVLSRQVGRTVIDKTGLSGKFDYTLHFTPENMPPRMGPGPAAGPASGPDGGKPGADAPPSPDTSGPDIFTALEEQLGLKLVSEKGPVDVIVIDHIDKPSEN